MNLCPFCGHRLPPQRIQKCPECGKNIDAHCARVYRENGNRLLEVENYDEALQNIDKAIEFDPNYADAWARLCLIYLDEHRFNHNPRPNPLVRALTAARRAVELDPTSQLGRSALAQAYFFRHELDAFLPELERALALNPNDVGTLAGVGTNLLYAGDERGITLIRRAMALDPFHPPLLYSVIAHYHFERGEYEEALAAARKGDVPGFYYTHLLLAAIYAELGRQSEAQSALEEFLRLWPGCTIETWTEQMRIWNYRDDGRGHWVAALRKAGLPE